MSDIEKETNVTVQVAGWVVGTSLLVGALIWAAWAIEGNDFLLAKYFAPKYEEVRRQTFEESKAYNDGMAQEVQNMQLQYIQADDTHKDAIASVVLHRVAGYDTSKLPLDTQTFIESLKKNRGLSK